MRFFGKERDRATRSSPEEGNVGKTEDTAAQEASEQIKMSGVQEALWVSGYIYDDKVEEDEEVTEEEAMVDEVDSIAASLNEGDSGNDRDDSNIGGANAGEWIPMQSGISRNQGSDWGDVDYQDIKFIDDNRPSNVQGVSGGVRNKEDVLSEMNQLESRWREIEETLEKLNTEKDLPKGNPPRDPAESKLLGEADKREKTRADLDTELSDLKQKFGALENELQGMLIRDQAQTQRYDSHGSSGPTLSSREAGGIHRQHPQTNRHIDQEVRQDVTPVTPIPPPAVIPTEDELLGRAADLGKKVRKQKPNLKKLKRLENKLGELEEKAKRVVRENSQVVNALPPGQDKPDGPDEIQKTRSKCEQLTRQVKPVKVERDTIMNNIDNYPKLKEALDSLKKKGDFRSKLFASIQSGDLPDVQAKCIALDLSDEHNQELQHFVHHNGYKPLHLALLFNRDSVAQFLIDHSGELLCMQDISRKCEYTKLTPLHLALYKSDPDCIKKIITSVPPSKKSSYINQRILVDSYMGQPYGELPLAATTWSCMQNQKMKVAEEILNYLVENGAEMDMKTKKDENTLLHLIVLQGLECVSGIKFFKEFLSEVFWPAAEKWWVKYKKEDKKAYKYPPKIEAIRHLMKLENKDDLTPLALAAKVESPVYLMLVQWEGVMCFPDPRSQRFAPKYCYDISDIVSVDEDGSYKSKSVMHILAHNGINLCGGRHIGTDFVDTEPIRTVLEKKWDYYSWFFYGWGLFHIIYMIILTSFTLSDISKSSTNISSTSTNASNASETNNSSTQAQENTKSGNPYFAFFLIVPIIYSVFEVCDFLFCDWFEMRYTITGNGVYRAISLLFSGFILSWFSLHIVGNVNQDVLLAISLLFGWIFCIFFTRTISAPSKKSQIGGFSIMVQRVLSHDLVPFMSISFFLIISFSAAIQATLLFSDPPKDSDFSFVHTLYQMIKYFAAMDDPMGEGTSREQHFVKTLLVIYGIIIAVLLINLLIAAMNKSYDDVRDSNCNLVMRQRLAILLMLERRLIGLRKALEKKLFPDEEDRPYITILVKSALYDILENFPNMQSKPNIKKEDPLQVHDNDFLTITQWKYNRITTVKPEICNGGSCNCNEEIMKAVRNHEEICCKPVP